MTLINHQVLTFCADDAHGAPIMMKADELGLDPTKIIDEIKKNHPELVKTLKLWKKQTGFPRLLNTSLNIKGKPMVNNEADAEAFAKHYSVKVV